MNNTSKKTDQNPKESQIYRRSCGHVIVRDKKLKSEEKIISTSLDESIERKEGCVECFRLNLQEKNNPADPKELAYVNGIKNSNKRIIDIPNARMKATLEIEESHKDKSGRTIITKAKLLSISLVPDPPEGCEFVKKVKK